MLPTNSGTSKRKLDSLPGSPFQDGTSTRADVVVPIEDAIVPRPAEAHGVTTTGSATSLNPEEPREVLDYADDVVTSLLGPTFEDNEI
eukprot:5851163-Pyramimonas_sp.AAC.1